METVLSIHRTWAYVAIAANAIAGIVMLLAWKIPRFRGRWNWWVTWAAEGMMLVQIALGITLVSSAKYKGVPRFHMFYGFIAFLTIGALSSYRKQLRGRPVMLLGLYGAAGLFIMGLGIRAILQVSP
ncbi:MAG: hypothetical protein WBD02_04860 [Acidimicrobiia bacterium]